MRAALGRGTGRAHRRPDKSREGWGRGVQKAGDAAQGVICPGEKRKRKKALEPRG